MPTPSHQDPTPHAVQKFAGNAQRLLVIAGIIIGLPFTWLQFKPFSPAALINTIDPDFLRRLILWIYYFCWVSGLTFDIHMQREIYSKDPHLGSVSRRAIAATGALIAIALGMFFAGEYKERFTALALIALLVINVFGWKILLERVDPIIKASAEAYRHDQQYFAVAQLEAISRYLKGYWQWGRFGGMLFIVLLLCGISYSDAARQEIVEKIHSMLPGAHRANVSALLPVLCLASFVIFAETWVWLMRHRTRTALSVIRTLNEAYTITPR